MTETATEIVSIPPGERRELRSVVRAQYKVLRAEVEARKAELLAEGEERLRQRYLAEDKKIHDMNKKIESIRVRAEKQIADAMAEVGLTDLYSKREVRVSNLYLRNDDTRSRLRQAFTSTVLAQAKAALLTLDRQEADLLKGLAIDSLKTEQGREFLRAIPEIVALMPSNTLKEVEQRFYPGKE